MGMYFGVVMKIVLIQKCFCYCWAELGLSQGLFCLSCHSTSEEVGSAQEADPSDVSDVSDHMSCSAYQDVEEGGSGVHLEMVFFFPSHHYAWYRPDFLGMAERLMHMQSEWILSFVLFVQSFCFNHLNPMIYFAFYFSYSLTHLTGTK